MSSNENMPINDPQGSARAFIEPDQRVPKTFGYNVFVVQMGKQGRLFKDGQFIRNLPPGRHHWWDFLGNYTVSMVDARVRLLTMLATGTIPGPVEEDVPTPPAKVKVPLRISAQLANIETLLNTEDPLGLLTAMITTFITTQIGRLNYDQSNVWVTNLRSELEQYLRYQAIPRTGLQVLEVFIQEPEGQAESDKRQLKLYQVVTEIKSRAKVDAAKNEGRVATAAAMKDQGALLGVNPFLIKLMETPQGVDIIKADLDLRKMAIAAGMISAADGTVLPPNPQQLRGSTYQENPASAGPGALGSPPTSGGYGSGGYGSGGYSQPGFSGNDPGGAPSGAWRSTPDFPSGAGPSYPPTYTPDPISGRFRDAPPTPQPGPTPPQDNARLAEEGALLRAKYTVQDTDAVFADAQDISVHGHEFTVFAGATATITIDAPPGFPTVAPVVWVKWPGEKSLKYRGDAIRDWTSATHLVAVVDEILQVPRA